jgi:hypothetical protein
LLSAALLHCSEASRVESSCVLKGENFLIDLECVGIRILKLATGWTNKKVLVEDFETCYAFA